MTQQTVPQFANMDVLDELLECKADADALAAAFVEQAGLDTEPIATIRAAFAAALPLMKLEAKLKGGDDAEALGAAISEHLGADMQAELRLDETEEREVFISSNANEREVHAADAEGTTSLDYVNQESSGFSGYNWSHAIGTLQIKTSGENPHQGLLHEFSDLEYSEMQCHTLVGTFDQAISDETPLREAEEMLSSGFLYSFVDDGQPGHWTFKHDGETLRWRWDSE
jgi:hypothetical protein